MSSSGKILVVDNNAPGREVKAGVLREAGYVVDEVDTGQAALERCGREPYVLVLLDVHLPDINGVEVCGHLKAAHPHLLVLQTSATPQAFDRVRSLQGGADACLVAPMAPAELLAITRSLLRLCEAETALRDSEARLQLAQDVADFAVLDWNIVTGEVACSDNFGAMFAFDMAREPVATMRDILGRVHPEDRGPLEVRFEQLRAAGGPFELEFRLKPAAHGAATWIASRGRFLKDGNGRTVRMLSVNSDATTRHAAEQKNGQLAAIVASSPDAIVSLDAHDRVLTWNAGAERLFGLPAENAIGEVAASLIQPERRDERTDAMARLQLGQEVEYESVREARDGSRVNVWVRGAPTRSADGRIDGACLIIRDTTAQKHREDHVRFLLRELTHRSKNLLAVIQAMARQSLNRLASPEEFVARFSERLSGLAGSHDLLSSEDFEGASLAQLIRSQLRHYGELLGDRILLDGVDLVLKPEAAQNVGIALHELSTNAAKYGALSTPVGTVRIGWTLEDDRFRMQWREQDGPPVVPPTRKGFGHVVMERITGQALNGRSSATFLPDGVCWTLDVPALSVLHKRLEDELPR